MIPASRPQIARFELALIPITIEKVGNLLKRLQLFFNTSQLINLMSEPFIGQIQTFGFNFAPRAWALCNGQLLPISQNTALFSLLGTIYGGDGRTTFALPDLRGRMPMHYGQGSGLSNRQISQSSGAESHQLSVGELPGHTHTHNVTAAVGDSPSPVGTVPATANDGESNYSTETSGLSTVSGNSQGGGQAHNNMPPFLVINFSIALTGIFPSRN